MADIDFGLAHEFVDPADVELAIDGWDDWATFYLADNGIDRHTNLAAIRRRIHAAGLD